MTHIHQDEDASKIPDVSIVESSAEMLYGLVHQRYILTRVGLQAMVRLEPSYYLPQKAADSGNVIL